MNYSIIAVPTFKKEVKKLAKKYHSIKTDLATLFATLEVNPTQGTSLGNNCYKIRMAIASKSKGKSGGARLITNFIISDSTVYLAKTIMLFCCFIFINRKMNPPLGASYRVRLNPSCRGERGTRTLSTFIFKYTISAFYECKSTFYRSIKQIRNSTTPLFPVNL